MSGAFFSDAPLFESRNEPVSYLTQAETGCVYCAPSRHYRRELAMNPARSHESPFGDGQRRREPVDSQSIATAVQVSAAWLIAFICVALLALFS